MFEALIKQILTHHPDKIILFGSQAKGTATDKSDIDICVVVSTDKKRRLAAEIQSELDIDTAVDIIIYTPDEWNTCVNDDMSFAYKISKEGVVLYG